MVIQRKQNLYLLVSLIFIVLFNFFPFVEFTTPDADYKLSILGLQIMGTDNTIAEEINSMIYSYGYLLIGILIAILNFVALISYKNLKFQKKLSTITLLLTTCFFISAGIYANFVMANLGMQTWSLCTAIIYPLISIIMLFMAVSGIKSDIKLLSDSTRIR